MIVSAAMTCLNQGLHTGREIRVFYVTFGLTFSICACNPSTSYWWWFRNLSTIWSAIFLLGTGGGFLKCTFLLDTDGGSLENNVFTTYWWWFPEVHCFYYVLVAVPCSVIFLLGSGDGYLLFNSSTMYLWWFPVVHFFLQGTWWWFPEVKRFYQEVIRYRFTTRCG